LPSEFCGREGFSAWPAVLVSEGLVAVVAEAAETGFANHWDPLRQTKFAVYDWRQK